MPDYVQAASDLRFDHEFQTPWFRRKAPGEAQQGGRRSRILRPCISIADGVLSLSVGASMREMGFKCEKENGCDSHCAEKEFHALFCASSSELYRTTIVFVSTFARSSRLDNPINCTAA
jgi:hypothetical protein